MTDDDKKRLLRLLEKYKKGNVPPDDYDKGEHFIAFSYQDKTIEKIRQSLRATEDDKTAS